MTFFSSLGSEARYKLLASIVLDLLSMATCGMPLVGEVLDALLSPRLASMVRETSLSCNIIGAVARYHLGSSVSMGD